MSVVKPVVVAVNAVVGWAGVVVGRSVFASELVSEFTNEDNDDVESPTGDVLNPVP